MHFFYQNLVFLAEREEGQKNTIERILGEGLVSFLINKSPLSPDQIWALSKELDFSIDTLFSKNLEKTERQKCKDLQLLIVDIDGVMTDGGMYYSESGDEFKKFNTKDGLAIRALTKKGFHIGIISSGFNQKLIQRRAELLGISKVHVGLGSKIEVLRQWCEELKIGIGQVAYIGDDINDEAAIQEVGFSACPADAMDCIKKKVHVVLTRKGGEGCVREFIDRYLSS